MNNLRHIGIRRAPLQCQHVSANDTLSGMLERDIGRRRVSLEGLTKPPNDQAWTAHRCPRRNRGVKGSTVDAGRTTEPKVDERRAFHPAKVTERVFSYEQELARRRFESRYRSKVPI